MTFKTFFAAFLALAALGPVATGLKSRPSRVVDTRQGKIQGVVREVIVSATDITASASGGSNRLQVETFLGIPFAAAPVGSLRFMPPVTASPWRGMRNATGFGPACPQTFPPGAVSGSGGGSGSGSGRQGGGGADTANLSRMSEGRWREFQNARKLLSSQSEDCLYLNVYTAAKDSGRNGECGL